MNGFADGAENFIGVGHSDVDFAADRSDRKSVTGSWITLNGMPAIWMTKKQSGVSLSTAEAEYVATSVVASQMLGLCEFLKELELQCEEPMVICVDNLAALRQIGENGIGEVETCGCEDQICEY